MRINKMDNDFNIKSLIIQNDTICSTEEAILRRNDFHSNRDIVFPFNPNDKCKQFKMKNSNVEFLLQPKRIASDIMLSDVKICYIGVKAENKESENKEFERIKKDYRNLTDCDFLGNINPLLQTLVNEKEGYLQLCFAIFEKKVQDRSICLSFNRSNCFSLSHNNSRELYSLKNYSSTCYNSYCALIEKKKFNKNCFFNELYLSSEISIEPVNISTKETLSPSHNFHLKHMSLKTFIPDIMVSEFELASNVFVTSHWVLLSDVFY